MFLNFGYILGYVIEKYYNFMGYIYGEVVVIGMYKIILESEKIGIIKKGILEFIKLILMNYNLFYEIELRDNKFIVDVIFFDKKNLGDILKIIFLKDIGESIIYNIIFKFF